MAGSAHATLDAVSRERSRRAPAGAARAARPLAAVATARTPDRRRDARDRASAAVGTVRPYHVVAGVAS
ncbi:hypothetical protein JK361_05770 [Streptomyces sp. 5-8]|uniref:Uncharacterized protein n=1 Tax=Streptomyces musisoli TaxID=2802280 RepID=A0ABS1NVH9_9ACTN|nr:MULTISPECIES: hypothetical protein [Streptomyces]MBL1104117.1 hypothetical protein [Streptomyces musisoli]MBY8840190.1 hypothetical protein [Streptomyces sp. SP2-10]